MIKLALERITLGGRVWLDGYIRLEEQPIDVSGANVAADNVHLYAKDNGGGISRLFYKDDGQVEHEVVTSGSGGGGVTDHGALTGLADDDHSLYLLAADATSRALFASNWLDLTDAGATTLHSHAPFVLAIGSAITSATEGSVLFAGAGGILAQDNANFFWDDTNNRLGLGTASPAWLLNISETAANTSWSGPTNVALITKSGALTSAAGTLNNVGLAITNSCTSIGAGSIRNVGISVDLSNADERIGLLLYPSGMPSGSNAIGIGGTPAPSTVFHSQSTFTRQFLFNRTETGVSLTDGTYIALGSNGNFRFVNQESDSLSDSCFEFAVDGGNQWILFDYLGNIGLSSSTRVQPGAGTNGIIFADGTALSSLASNTAGLYANDVGGTVSMHAIHEDGKITDLATLHSTGTASTFVGVGAGNLTHSVGYNTGVGTGVLAALTEGFFNTAMGRLALTALTSGDRNVAIGTNALIALTTGNNNTALGSDALGALQSGSSFIGIGQSALLNAVSGTDNVGIGETSMNGLTTGSYNTAVGALALSNGAMVGALANTGCGRGSLYALAEADFNSGLGYNSLSGVTTGDSNTGVGDRAGVVITTGSNNTFLGALADASANNLANAAAIGANAVVASSNHIMLGDSAVTVGIAGAARPTGSGGLIFPDGTILSSMASNTAGLYANDVGGTVTMFSMNEAGLASQHGPWGVYTPTLTNVANLSASTAYSCQYVRFGNIVTVSGKVAVDPTLAATATQLGISLPIASDIGAAEDCAGVAFASGIAGQGAAILGDATNDRAEMNWISTDITNQPMYFQFTYEVL